MVDDEADAKIFAKQGSITFIGNISNKILGFVFLAVITRLVSPRIFGIYSLGVSVILFIKGFANLNLQRSVDYFIPQYIAEGEQAKAKSLLVNVIIIGLFSTTLTAVFIVIGRHIISSIFSEPLLSDILVLLCLVLPLAAINSAFVASFNSIKKLKYRVYTQNLILPISKLVLAVGFIYGGFELFGLVGAYVISFLCATVAGGLLLIKNVDWIRGTDRISVPRREIISYSLPLVFVGVIYATVGQVDYFVIGYFSQSEDVGFYRVAFVLSANLLIFISSITPIFKPMIAEKKQDITILKSRYQLATRWILLTTVPAAITLALASEEYLTLFFTEEYTTASGVVVVLVAGYIINALAGPEGMLLEGLGYTKLTLFNTIFLITTNAGLDILLVPQIGMLGAAIGTATAYTVTVFLGVGEIYYLKSIHPYTIDVGKTLISGLPAIISGMVVVSIATTIITAILLPIVVLMSYVITLIALNGFTEDDKIVAQEVDNRVGYKILGHLVPDE